MSKTKDALLLVDRGMRALEAARQVGLTPNALYVAIKRRRDQQAVGLERCPCCGTVVPKDQLENTRGSSCPGPA